MGQAFVVDNRAGAAGLIGAEIVAKAPPDGYNVLFTTASLAVNVSLYKKSSVDPAKDLIPVSWISSVPLVLVVHPSVPANNVKELVALAKKRAGKMNAASNGSGTTSHLSIEMLKQMAGVNVTHIPYKGGGPAMTAMLTGEVDFSFNTALTTMPHIKAGKIRALAVTTAKPSSSFPKLPTMASMYPGFESDNWYAMFLPVNTSKEIVAKLNAEILKALKSPDVRDFITREGWGSRRQLSGRACEVLQARSRQVRTRDQGRKHHGRNKAHRISYGTPVLHRAFCFKAVEYREIRIRAESERIYDGTL
jgi:tripartite-type tricarboxylate transporter receptor subunit TctC